MKLMFNDQQIGVVGIGGGTAYDNLDDPMNCGNITKWGVFNAISDIHIVDGEAIKRAFINTNAGTGYEGICFDLSKFNLVEGQSYTITLDLLVPSGFIWTSGNYPFGILHSPTQIAENSSAFNLTPTSSFTKNLEEQTISMQFTATANNYLVVCLAISDGTNNQGVILTLDNIVIE